MNTTIEEVERFLNDLKVKLLIKPIRILDGRQKNARTVLALNISQHECIQVIENLEKEDFSEGPLTDAAYQGPDMWVFGKYVKSEEIYIKLTLGIFNGCPVCISFHIAEHPMNYPFKQ